MYSRNSTSWFDFPVSLFHGENETRRRWNGSGNVGFLGLLSWWWKNVTAPEKMRIMEEFECSEPKGLVKAELLKDLSSFCSCLSTPIPLISIHRSLLRTPTRGATPQSSNSRNPKTLDSPPTEPFEHSPAVLRFLSLISKGSSARINKPHHYLLLA
jgi:hypothetical protein